ncbi:protein FAM117B-like isoform X2 [Cylas formicarius]|uniref:protein FAM117B-like isoform X2 n=1 Tax=Cylas formicarius TaxID=197179 RepID=UPI002958B8EF|nr:protein FAM117B-like isoform X2 [Cylas formicarius]
MSTQHTYKTPNKHGPMKAIIPITDVLKPSSGFKDGISCTNSPPLPWKAGPSSYNASGQRSPGSACYKGKSKCYDNGLSDSIRRTASLDTIYLKGQWPRDNFYWHTGTLQIDKATQTDENEWSDKRKVHNISDLEAKIHVRSKIWGNKETNRHISPSENMLHSSSQTLTSCILSPTPEGSSVLLPLRPLPKSSIRNSVEGLNQEIERIVLKTGCGSHQDDRFDIRQATPEGHKAPLSELLRSNRTHSVNTQTPQGLGSSSNSSGSQGSSPDGETTRFGTSPQINKFLAREPPDGCEKVLLKSVEGKKCIQLALTPPPSTFKLRPSLGSAFHTLKPKLSPGLEQASPEEDCD